MALHFSEQAPLFIIFRSLLCQQRGCINDLKFITMQNLSITICILALAAQSSIYNIPAVSVKGKNINIGSFANKKIVISPFDAADPNTTWLRQLDSLQRSNTSIQVIAVPANDFTGPVHDDLLVRLQDSLELNLIIVKCTAAKKSARNTQHLLFKWLTDVNENTHFDLDVRAPDELFIVSKTGTLYSVLSAGVPLNILSDVLSRDIEQSN